MRKLEIEETKRKIVEGIRSLGDPDDILVGIQHRGAEITADMNIFVMNELQRASSGSSEMQKISSEDLILVVQGLVGVVVSPFFNIILNTNADPVMKDIMVEAFDKFLQVALEGKVEGLQIRAVQKEVGDA